MGKNKKVSIVIELNEFYFKCLLKRTLYRIRQSQKKYQPISKVARDIICDQLDLLNLVEEKHFGQEIPFEKLTDEKKDELVKSVEENQEGLS